MRDNDMLSEMRNSAAPESASDECLDNNFALREKLPETGTARNCPDRKGSPISTKWDGRYERGYGELMERDCERERYQAIGQIVVALPAHSSLLDVGCGVGTMADYLPALDYTGVDVSHKALTIARDKHSGTFICSEAEDFHIDKKFDVILFNETLYYLEDPLVQLARYREFLSDGGSMIASIWLPDFEHPKREHHLRLIDEIIHSDVFAQCPMQMRDVGEAELRWKVIRIGRPAVEAARRMKELLVQAGYRVMLDSPTNQVLVELSDAEAERLAERVGYSFWERSGEGRMLIRLAASWATSTAQVDELAEALAGMEAPMPRPIPKPTA